MGIPTTKPTSYTVNTGHAKCPDYAYMINEGTGYTLADEGKSGPIDMQGEVDRVWGSTTLGNFVSIDGGDTMGWYADGTYDAITDAAMIVCIMRQPASTLAIAGHYASFGPANTSTNGPTFALRFNGTSGNQIAHLKDQTALTATTGTWNVEDGNWHMTAAKCKSDGTLAYSVDGGAWQEDADADTPTITGWMNSHAIGRRVAVASGTPPTVTGGSSDLCGITDVGLTVDIASVFFYKGNLYDTWSNAWISELYTDPYQFLNEIAGETKMYANGAFQSGEFVEISTGPAMKINSNTSVHPYEMVEVADTQGKLYANGTYSCPLFIEA
jgi:hypothetical protein